MLKQFTLRLCKAPFHNISELKPYTDFSANYLRQAHGQTVFIVVLLSISTPIIL